MEAGIGPASDGIFRGVFPGLQAVSMVEVVARLPVVEDLVAVLNRRKGGSDKVGDGEDGEGSKSSE